MKTLLVTVDSLRHDTYREHMPATREYLDWEHNATFSSGPNTGEAFPAIVGGEYPRKTGLIPDSSVAAEFDTYKAGVTTNRLLSPKYGYDEGFDEFSSPTGDGGSVKDKAARYVTQGSLFYRLGTKLWNAVEYVTPSPFEPSFRPAREVIDDFERIDRQHDNWFVWLHFMEPHHPYEPPTADNRLAARQLSRSVIAGNDVSDDDERRVRSYYRQEVAALDDELNRLWGSLADDTRVVFCADHGELMGEDGEWGHIGTFKQEVLQVPLGGTNVRKPGDLASLVDVPTLLLGDQHNQGTFDRDIAYATNGTHWAATDGEEMATPEGVFDLRDGTKTENPTLERAQTSFDVKTGVLDEADTDDLEHLGYL